jgi:DUF1680 family protein
VTNYPYDDEVTIVVLANAPLPLYVRIPCWASNASLWLNEQELPQPSNCTMFKV